jgi:outer membrane protein insertion porin family
MTSVLKDSPVIKERTLRGKLKSKEKTFWRLWGKAGKLNNQALQEDVKIIEHSLQDEGLVYAKVTEVRREPVGSEQGGSRLCHQRRAKYDVADVSVQGNTSSPRRS